MQLCELTCYGYILFVIKMKLRWKSFICCLRLVKRQKWPIPFPCLSKGLMIRAFMQTVGTQSPIHSLLAGI